MNTRKLSITACVGSLLILLHPGCTTVNTVENAQPVAQKQMLADKRVITDSTLNRHINILGVNTATGPAGFLKIQVKLQNRMSSPWNFTYRVEWFDENGMIIDLPTSSSVPRTIEGKETLTITSTAPTDRAKDFRIKFLESTN